MYLDEFFVENYLYPILSTENPPLNPPQGCRLVIDTTVAQRRHGRAGNSSPLIW